MLLIDHLTKSDNQKNQSTRWCSGAYSRSQSLMLRSDKLQVFCPTLHALPASMRQSYSYRDSCAFIGMRKCLRPVPEPCGISSFSGADTIGPHLSCREVYYSEIESCSFVEMSIETSNARLLGTRFAAKLLAASICLCGQCSMIPVSQEESSGEISNSRSSL